MIDYPCVRFDDFSFSLFGFIVRTDTQTHRRRSSSNSRDCRQSEQPKQSNDRAYKLIYWELMGVLSAFSLKNNLYRPRLLTRVGTGSPGHGSAIWAGSGRVTGQFYKDLT